MKEQKIYFNIRRTNGNRASCTVFAADDDGNDLRHLATLDVEMTLTYWEYEPPARPIDRVQAPPFLDECLDRINAATKADPRWVHVDDGSQIPF